MTIELTQQVRDHLVTLHSRTSTSGQVLNATNQLLAADGLVHRLVVQLERTRRQVTKLADDYDRNATDLDHRTGQAPIPSGEHDMLDNLRQLYESHARSIRQTLT